MQAFSNGSQQLLTQLLEQAANNTSEGITISSMDQPDRPLIYLNEGFERLTGYSQEEAIGKNCRFLQGPDTDPDVVSTLRKALHNGEQCTVELLNYKKNGTPFWNRLSISPLTDPSGNVTHFVGVQSDITELRETQERLRRANSHLQQFHRRITKDLERAKAAQEFLLPSELPQSDKVRFAAKFQPMEQIGGDFFDVIQILPDVYGVLIADVTGHGIPAALITFMSSTTFKNSAQGILSTAEAIKRTNQKLHGRMADDAFVTMFYAIYDARRQQLTFTQAGHPEGYVLRPATNELIPLSTGDIFLGVLASDETQFTEKRLALHPGDKVLLYTDAIIEVMDFSHDRDVSLRQFLRDNLALPLDALFERMYAYGLELSEQRSYPDDFTLIGFDVL